MRKYENKIPRIIYPELSYRINGIIFSVRKELGNYCNEKQYCDAIQCKLIEQDIQFEREKMLPKFFEGENANRNKVDFLIEDKIVLEIKAKRFQSRDDYYQIRRYLNSLNKKLGIIVNFHQKYVKPKRIINSAGKE